MKRIPPLHPILFSLYFILGVTSVDPSLIFYLQSGRSLFLAPLLVLSVMGLLAIRIKDWHRTSFLTTLAIFLFLYYGHIYRVIKQGIPALTAAVPEWVLFSIWAVLICLIGSPWVWKHVKKPETISRFLGVIAIAAILLPLYTTIKLWILIRRDPFTNWTRPASPEDSGLQLRGEQNPDIYYIIVDGYARQDVLNELYGFKNNEFIRFLESRGFYVASDSRSNYVRTSFSLASSLNFEYINYLESPSYQTANWFPLQKLIAGSRVRSLLENAGYRIVTLSSGYFYTEIRDSDTYLRPYLVPFNDFEQLLLSTTALRIPVEYGWLDIPTFGYTTHRRVINYEFKRLEKLPAMEGPKFVFAHIFSPHPPFIFEANGQPKEKTYPFTTGDADEFPGSRQEYQDGYVNQMEYINNRLEQTIDSILQNSKRPVIIIIQGDHGPGSLLDWESMDNTCIFERFSILNAYYFPEPAPALYESVTPVNSFRLLFDAYFSTDLGRLEDKSYFSTNSHPYQFIDVTETTNFVSCPVSKIR